VNSKEELRPRIRPQAVTQWQIREHYKNMANIKTLFPGRHMYSI
jgi:hypothetical protein